MFVLSFTQFFKSLSQIWVMGLFRVWPALHGAMNHFFFVVPAYLFAVLSYPFFFFRVLKDLSPFVYDFHDGTITQVILGVVYLSERKKMSNNPSRTVCGRGYPENRDG